MIRSSSFAHILHLLLLSHKYRTFNKDPATDIAAVFNHTVSLTSVVLQSLDHEGASLKVGGPNVILIRRGFVVYPKKSFILSLGEERAFRVQVFVSLSCMPYCLSFCLPFGV